MLRVYGGLTNDTSRARFLSKVGEIYLATDPDSATAYGTAAYKQCTKLGMRKSAAHAYKIVGTAYAYKGKYIESLQHYEQSLKLYEGLDDKNGQTSLLKNIGGIYGFKGDDDKALDHYLQALSLSEEIQDTLQQISSLSNIGTIYMYKPATHDKAFQFLHQAYALSKRYDDANALGTIAVNLGELYLAHEKFDSAMFYFNVSTKAFQGTADVAYTMNNIGKLYLQQKQFNKAVAIQKAAIGIAKQYDSQDNVLVSLVGIAQTYEQQGNVSLALSYYEQAEAVANAMGARYALVDVYQGLAKSHASLNDYTNAFR